MLEKHKNGIYSTAIIFVCVVMMGAATAFPQKISNAAKDGLELCVSTMIPTLFPLLVLTSFLLRSGAIDYPGRKADTIALKLFGLSGNAAAVFLISLFSGFPVGASLVSKLTGEGKITKSEGARLMTCCVNAGPAFVIGAVGAEMFQSRRAGAILFASLTLSAVTAFVLTRFVMKSETAASFQTNVPDFSSSLVGSVFDAAQSMVSICGWIIVFSCVGAFVSQNAEKAMMFLEVSIGCKISSGYPLPVTALIIGWGGVCVHCQVFHAVVKSEMKKTTFFFFRLLNGVLASGICAVLVRIFPCAVQTLASSPEKVSAAMTSNAAACAGLLLMCAILIVDFEETRGTEGQFSQKSFNLKNLKNLRKNEKTIDQERYFKVKHHF